MNKRISVIMACYNCEKTVQRALDSIYSQTYSDWVLICCDDGSTDKTLVILEENRRLNPNKIVIIKNDGNKKLPYSLNHCLKYVDTEFVARMDADDISEPTRFEKQIEFLIQNPKYDLVGTGISVSDGRKEIASMIRIKEPSKQTMLKQYAAFSHATIMTYKRVYDALDGYSLNPDVILCEDTDLWCRFFARGFRGYNIPDNLYTVVEDDEVFVRKASGNDILKGRIRFAKTLSNGYRIMGFTGIVCYKPYLSVVKALVPPVLYKYLHIMKLNSRAKSI